MPEFTDEHVEDAHNWRLVLTDVRYALGQLRRRCLGAMQTIEGMCLRDDVTRAVDALERVEALAKCHRDAALAKLGGE